MAVELEHPLLEQSQGSLSSRQIGGATIIALKTDTGNKYSRREYENAKQAGRRERSEDFSSNNEMSVLQETLVSVVSPR